MTNQKNARTNQEAKNNQREQRRKENLGMFDTEFANEFNIKHVDERKNEERRNKEREKRQGKC